MTYLYQAEMDRRPITTARSHWLVAAQDLVNAQLAHWEDGRLKVEEGAGVGLIKAPEPEPKKIERSMNEDWKNDWPIGLRVTKKSGSSWTGHIVGHYSTSLTPRGVCVESENEQGSVQIYPVKALEGFK